MRQPAVAAGGGPGRTLRLTVLVLAGGLVLTGCGSRLTADQVAHYAGPASAELSSAAPAEDGAADGSNQDGATSAADTAQGGASVAPSQGAGAPQQAGWDQQQGQTSPSGDDASGVPRDAGNSDGGADTRAAPPGGNGGATDVGVTADTITIFNIADLSGAVPGLFRDAYEATLAYVQYFTATEGTVYGRKIELVSRDTQLSSQGNRSAYLDACNQAFAAVGSMSAFEEGAADPIESCGLPDLRTTPASRALQALPTSLGMLALRPGDFSLAEYQYYKQRFPEAIKNAGYVWIENQTTNYQVSNYMAGTEPIGYVWKAKIPVALSETNYARIVTQLRNDDIQIVFFLGAYQQAARLAQAMQQQDYVPKTLALQSNMYSQDLISTCGEACEAFTMVAQNGGLIEEISSNPELQLYAEWLARINPRARPTGLGMYAWSAAKLFIESIKEVGPDLTRQALLDELATVDDYTADGLIPPQHIGTQQASGCVIMLDIEDGAFHRVAPEQDYLCEPGHAPGG